MDKGNSGFATDTMSAKHVMYKGIDLLKLAESAEEEVQSAKTINTVQRIPSRTCG
jgi:hypothetical protein